MRLLVLCVCEVELELEALAGLAEPVYVFCWTHAVCLESESESEIEPGSSVVLGEYPYWVLGSAVADAIGAVVGIGSAYPGQMLSMPAVALCCCSLPADHGSPVDPCHSLVMVSVSVDVIVAG